MRRLLICASVVLLSACATVRDARHDTLLFHDAWFAPPSSAVDGEGVFALSDSMRQFLRSEINPRAHRQGAQAGLFNALQDSGQLKIEYDASLTRNAAEAFQARSGNCLSLVILTAALARELNLEVQFQEVLGDPTMSRNGNLLFYNRHVNLLLSEASNDPQTSSTSGDAVVIDFLPSRERRDRRVQAASEQTIVAMYMNNRAAERLAEGSIDDAYWWARAAIRYEPRFTGSYNTLGVAYRRHGDLPQAASVFEHVLMIEPANSAAMSNLILVLNQLGRAQEAVVWQRRLQELQPLPPFHFFDQGRRAMLDGDYPRAREFFVRELERTAYYHEFHFWLALAYVGLQQSELARKHFTAARDNATRIVDAERYQQMLDALRDNNGNISLNREVLVQIP